MKGVYNMNHLIIDNKNGEILFETTDEQECKEFMDVLNEENITQFNNVSIYKNKLVRRSIIKGS
jgi:hypothetical protein